MTYQMSMRNYEFTPGVPLLARKPFTYTGESVERGALFNYDKLGVNIRKIYQMIEAGKVMPITHVSRSELDSMDYRQLQFVCRQLKVKGNGSLGDIQERVWERIKEL